MARGAIAAILFALASAFSAQAQTPDGFYKGRSVSIVMGTGPGGSYDLYARLIANHYGRHLPGNPTFTVEHMPGAGGAIAANNLFGVAPQDGSKILLAHSLPLIETLQPSNIRFKSTEFQWLGAYDQISQVLAIWHTQPGRNVAELKGGNIVLGAMGRNHLTYQWATLLKDSLGAPFKIVTGYTTGGALNIAMEKGEIAGWPAAWENLSGRNAHWLRDKLVHIPVVFTLKRMRELPDVPTLSEITTGEAREIAEFLASGTVHARALAVGPKVPADRVEALRKGFDAMVADKAFLAEAEKLQLAIEPRSAKETLDLAARIVNASPQFIEKVKKAVGAE